MFGAMLATLFSKHGLSDEKKICSLYAPDTKLIKFRCETSRLPWI